MDEQDRIRAAYRRRQARAAHQDRFFDYESPSHVYRIHDRYLETMRLLRRYGFHPLTNLRILSVGCGTGRMLRQYAEWGAKPIMLAGIDLVADRIEKARQLSPHIDLRCGDASQLPWPDEEFDLVGQSTVFTSILDPGLRKRVAAEMVRVLKPGGAVVWYDFFYDNPKNPDVRGVRAHEIRELFPSLKIHLQKITLAAPVARQFPAPVAPLLNTLLGRIPMLRTHYLGIFIKPRQSPAPEMLR